jgi:hypothetical protein
MPIPISVTGLAKFMRANALRQRSLLRDYKFPFTADGRRKPQIVRYSEARTAIKKYHSAGNDITVLIQAVEDLVKKGAENPEKDQARIEDNIRAVKTYMKYFSENKFTVLETPRPKYVHGEVVVSALPDLYVDEGGTRKLIKLDFNRTRPLAGEVDIILKVMHEAAMHDELEVKPANVIYLDVTRQEHYNGAKLNKRLKREIDAACETIEDIWPRLKRS